MAVTTIDVEAPPERVFAVLADPTNYPDWVVGAKRIRDFDEGWPAPGTRFHHTIGVGPLTQDDDTRVVGSAPPRTLVLSAGMGRLGRARIVLHLRELETGRTHVVMHETAEEGVAATLMATLGSVGLRVRNWASLDRLKELAESRAATPPA
jgi:uncharacterized protein YndB with AHSA1/START domain